MRTPRVPAGPIGGASALAATLLRLAAEVGLAPAEGARLVNLLPAPIEGAPCFHDLFTGLLRYEFGSPIKDVPGVGLVFGTHMFPPVEQLFLVLRCVSERLTPTQRKSYLHRLADQNKHRDILAEFIPIVRLQSDVPAEYEVPGGGAGNQTVDWRITPESRPSVLLDVKNRMRDLIENFAQIGRGERSQGGTAPMPRHDSSLLFRSLESKFGHSKPSDCLQGAWVSTNIQQEEAELHAAFQRLDTGKVHFVILGGTAGGGEPYKRNFSNF